MFTITTKYTSPIRSLNFAPDGQHLVANNYLYRLVSKEQMRDDIGYNYFAKSRFFPDGRYFVFTDLSNGIFLSDFETETELNVFPANSYCNFLLGPSQQILVTRQSSSIRPVEVDSTPTTTALLDVSTPWTPKIIWQTEENKACFCAELAASPDKLTFAAIEFPEEYGQSRRLAINRFDTGELVRVIMNLKDSGQPPSLHYQPSGEHLMSVTAESITLYNIQTGLRVRTIARPKGGRFQAIAMHPNGRNFLSLQRLDGMVHVWNAETFEISHSYQWPIKKGESLAISPDGLTCAVGDSVGNIIVWDWED